MTVERAKEELPIWSASQIPQWKHDLGVLPWRMRMENKIHEWKLHHGIITGFFLFLIGWTFGTVMITGAIVRHNVLVELPKESAEQTEVQATPYILTGEDSLNNAISSAVDAVAPVIGKLQTDEQKLTETGIMLARVMSGQFPNSFEEVAAQRDQWSLYDGTDRTFNVHDKELAEQIIRPYMEDEIVPIGLTKKICWCSWSPTDLVGRDDYEEVKATVTWRYHG